MSSRFMDRVDDEQAEVILSFDYAVQDEYIYLIKKEY